MEPVLIAIGIDRKAVTDRLIRDGGAFSVNLWDRADTRIFRSFSKPATREGTKLNGRPVREGITGVPIFEEAVAWLECRLFQTVEFVTHDLFVGEVVDAGFRDGGRDTPIARMEDTRMKYGGVRRGGH
jgi:flavin reductase (DIM6/NTAB) family NADH-FMN oxidoreductase RutF